MLNLVPAIKEIEKVIREKESTFNQEIQPYKDSLAQLRKLNETCEECGGRGWTLRPRACAEDDRPDPNDPTDRLKCYRCGGTGRTLPDFGVNVAKATYDPNTKVMLTS